MFWANFNVPFWFFSYITNPFMHGPLSAVPASGTIALIGALLLALVRREGGIFRILPSVILTHLIISLSALFAGQFGQPWLLIGPVLVVQLGMAIAIIAKCRRSRLAGILAAWFTLSYALFAAVISAMSLAGSYF